MHPYTVGSHIAHRASDRIQNLRRLPAGFLPVDAGRLPPCAAPFQMPEIAMGVRVRVATHYAASNALDGML